MMVKKADGSNQPFDIQKIFRAVDKAFSACGMTTPKPVYNRLEREFENVNSDITVEEIQDRVENVLMDTRYSQVAKAYIIYRYNHKRVRQYADEKMKWIDKYKHSNNTANATIDDNSNVSGKNVGILNAEAHKEDNIPVVRRMVMKKLAELYPDFDPKQYERDLKSHIIYKHDESSFVLPVPYCASITMYPFLTDGIKGLGGLSAAPKNLDSFCGMYVNLIFAVSAGFAGAVATSEFLLYFDYFARKEWGDDYWQKVDVEITSPHCNRSMTIQKQIHQHFQQVIYSINQPAAARGMQSAFVNFSYFDKPFFDGMFGDFYFPDGTKPQWVSLCWLQKDFMQWFNAERLRCILTFPVESVTLLYKDGEFQDKDMYKFVCDEYARGHSFFTYISDTVDSLSSCCRLKNKLQTKEFNFTNGNMGIQTGSKSVITLNLNRIIQDYCREIKWNKVRLTDEFYNGLKEYLTSILGRIYKYHNAYNELLWDAKNAGLLPAYDAGFINLDKQYLTIGLNGLNEAAEFLGLEVTDNKHYSRLCQEIFSTIKEQNIEHKTKRLTFNTEMVPAESLAIKNYNWDKEDGYVVPQDRNLYASYIFLPSSDKTELMERIRMHGNDYIGDYLDGGSAAHLNLDSHLSTEQYAKILRYAAKQGCSYLTFNIPNSECQDCGFITKVPISECPHCHSKRIDMYDRVIGYLTKISKWSQGRQEEQKTRVYQHIDHQ